MWISILKIQDSKIACQIIQDVPIVLPSHGPKLFEVVNNFMQPINACCRKFKNIILVEMSKFSIFIFVATCEAEFEAIDLTLTVKSDCSDLGTTSVQNLTACKAWACQQGANTINWYVVRVHQRDSFLLLVFYAGLILPHSFTSRFLKVELCLPNSWSTV